MKSFLPLHEDQEEVESPHPGERDTRTEALGLGQAGTFRQGSNGA